MELYDSIGRGYGRFRRPDPRIAAAIARALGAAESVANVGAGAGSYEPRDRNVIAVEPSLTMLRQRAREAAPAVRAVASALPFRDASFDASLAVLTVHHWPDRARGIAELRRTLGCTTVLDVPVPRDCADGFQGAYWCRPEAYLDPGVRSAISSFARLTAVELEDGLARLRADLASDEWERRHGALRRQDQLDLGYRLVVAESA